MPWQSSRAFSRARIGGSIFYYFPTQNDLLIAALEHASAERLERHGAEVASATSLGELLALLERIDAEDHETGFVRVVSEMVAGSVANPDLGPASTASASTSTASRKLLSGSSHDLVLAAWSVS